jgi:hypothetical protein
MQGVYYYGILERSAFFLHTVYYLLFFLYNPNLILLLHALSTLEKQK